MTTTPALVPYDLNAPSEVLYRLFSYGQADLNDPATLRQAQEALAQVGTETTFAEGDTILLRAASVQHPLHVAFLLQHGANVHHIGSGGLTALHYASLPAPESHRNMGRDGGLCVRMLLDAGADMGIAEKRDRTPLVLALDYVECRLTDNDLSGLLALIERGALLDVSPKHVAKFVERSDKHASVADVVLDPDHKYPKELVACVQSWVSKANLVENLGDTVAAVSGRRSVKL